MTTDIETLQTRLTLVENRLKTYDAYNDNLVPLPTRKGVTAYVKRFTRFEKRGRDYDECIMEAVKLLEAADIRVTSRHVRLMGFGAQKIPPFFRKHPHLLDDEHVRTIRKNREEVERLRKELKNKRRAERVEVERQRAERKRQKQELEKTIKT